LLPATGRRGAMKTVLIFGDDESDEARIALEGVEWKGAVQDFDEWLKGKIKHGGKPWQEVRTALRASIQTSGLSLE
jgi:hypothetical protein